ncbi:hypothetical protein TNCV_5055081 [Trichonephila clavipes]|nr:hypothetical protein TNCV_5055081 [Trichonephila clavipes]
MVKESRNPSDNRRSLSSKNRVVISDVERMGEQKQVGRDGQVCPDVGQGIMAPWARRRGCVLVCYAQIGRERPRETFCDLPGRRDEERVVYPPLVFKRVFFQETGELERGALPWMEKKKKALPWIEKA